MRQTKAPVCQNDSDDRTECNPASPRCAHGFAAVSQHETRGGVRIKETIATQIRMVSVFRRHTARLPGDRQMGARGNNERNAAPEAGAGEPGANRS